MTTNPLYQELINRGAPTLSDDLYFKISSSAEYTDFLPTVKVSLYRKRKNWFDKRLATRQTQVDNIYDETASNRVDAWTPGHLANMCIKVYEMAFPPNKISDIQKFFGKLP